MTENDVDVAVRRSIGASLAVTALVLGTMIAFVLVTGGLGVISSVFHPYVAAALVIGVVLAAMFAAAMKAPEAPSK